MQAELKQQAKQSCVQAPCQTLLKIRIIIKTGLTIAPYDNLAIYIPSSPIINDTVGLKTENFDVSLKL